MSGKANDDTGLVQFATVRELELLDAIRLHGSQRKAAKALGLAHGTLSHAVGRLKSRAALKGYSPEHDLTHPAAPGQRLRGASTLYRRGEVEPVMQWVKTTADDEARDAIMREAIAVLCEEVTRAAPIKAPPRAAEHLCNVYMMTDCHYGMLAWNREGGADWDLKIAERILTGCFEEMVGTAPKAGVGIVAQCGDWLHSDGSQGMQAVTPTSGHSLDQDGRFAKVVGGAIRVLRRLVDVALSKHPRVVVLMAEGNHDIASSVWLRVLFKALYENEPRVEVIDSELPYYVYQHGQTMLAFHHGHLKRNDDLPLLFAAQFPRVWGDTLKRYAHCGHRHHLEVKEHAGMTVVQYPTLAARDAYAARGGWISERQAQAVTYHARHGHVGTTVVTPEMLEDEAA